MMTVGAHPAIALHQPSRKRARSASSPKSPGNATAQLQEEQNAKQERSSRRRRRRVADDDDDDEEEDEEEDELDEDEEEERMRLLDAHRESLLSQALEGRSSQSLMAHLLATRRASGNQSEASSITGHTGAGGGRMIHQSSGGHHQHDDDDASDTDDTDASDR